MARSPTSAYRGSAARAEPYVRALGMRGAFRFLLTYGGRIVHIPSRDGSRSALVRAIGQASVAALRQEVGAGQVKVPFCRAWIARRLDDDGVSRPDIANRLRVTRECVRQYLASAKAEARP